MPTLTPTTILAKTMEAYRTRYPFVRSFGVDFSTDAPLRLDQTVIAHIRTLPTVASYDGSTGYANGATSARTLLTDVPIVVDQHKHVPVYLDHLDAIKDQKDAFMGTLADQGYQLGKAQIDSILGKCKGSNLSYSKTFTAANSDLDAITEINSFMTDNLANPVGRVGLVSTAVADALSLDSRIASRDYYGILGGDQGGLRVFRGVGGFSAIYEYPGLPTNNTSGQTFTANSSTDICTATDHGFSTGDRVRVSSSSALPSGLAANTTYFVIRLTANTFSLATSDANATAGTAINITDTGTGTHTVTGFENVIGLFFEPQAIAFRAGVPAQSGEIARAMGIPETARMLVERDPVIGMPMAHISWMQPATIDLYSTVTSIWGSAVGRQAGAASALTDRSACLLRSA